MSKPDPEYMALFDAYCSLARAHGKLEWLVDEYREAGKTSLAAAAAMELDKVEDAMKGLRNLVG